MNKKLLRFFRPLVAILFCVFFTANMSSQCVLINEVMVNPSSACDGSCTPSTAEWVELYNTCNVAVDLGCYVLTDGDFSVTIPPGTMIAANGFLMIGSTNSGNAVNIDWGTCGCTSGPINQVGIFTNSNEQLAFTNGAEVLQDAIYWGTGQFAQTPSFTTNTIGACASITIPLSASNPIFQALPSQSGNDGFSLFRSCDGNTNWLSGGAAPTPGTSNGTGDAIEANFEASLTSICAGECIDFSSTGTGTPTSWAWQFPGSAIPNASSANVSSVCYLDGGTFDVTLTVANACGQAVQTMAGYIVVSGATAPAIQANGPLSFCVGGSVTLSTNSTEALQWYMNSEPITDATGNQLVVMESGSYYVATVNGSCSFNSAALNVVVSAALEPIISSDGDLTICMGESVNLQAPLGFGSYQWMLNDEQVADSTSSSFTAYTAGNYSVIVTSGSCNGVSNVLEVLESVAMMVAISPGTLPTQCPNAEVLLNATEGFTEYTWLQNSVEISTGAISDFTITEQGNYQVQATDEFGCINVSEVVVVNYYPSISPQQNPPSTTVICPGETATLGILPSPGNMYQWYLNNQPISNATNASFVANQGGTYHVTVTNADGCEFISNNVQITAALTPAITLTPSSPIVTCTVPIVIQASIPNMAGATWQWSSESGILNGQTASSLSINASGNYFVAVTSSAGCSAISSVVPVTINNPIDVMIITSNATPCVGQTVQLSLSGNFQNIMWSNSSNTNMISVSQSGNYSVQATDVNGCQISTNATVNFTPLPIVNAGIDTVANCITGVVLNGFSSANYSWSPFVGLSNSSISNPVAIPATSTVYTLTATVNGCSASDNVFVYADCGDIIIPNIFSPNGDGINDTFEIVSNGIAKYDISIYNRWGQMVFNTTNENTHWSGKYNGEDVAEGTYYYIIVAFDSNGKSLIAKGEESGKLTLLR